MRDRTDGARYKMLQEVHQESQPTDIRTKQVALYQALELSPRAHVANSQFMRSAYHSCYAHHETYLPTPPYS